MGIYRMYTGDDGETHWEAIDLETTPDWQTELSAEHIVFRTDPVGINEDEYGCSVRNDANVYGPLSVAVPGQMAAMGMLWERWGRQRWPPPVPHRRRSPRRWDCCPSQAVFLKSWLRVGARCA